MKYSIDINCDVGEGIGNEAEMMPFISSCSIACGGHAGDENTMRKVVRLAKEHNVKIGAHPSFPDRANFGRKPMPLTNKELVATIIDQIDALHRILIEEGAELHHIKPHGALYNMAANTTTVALSVIEAMMHLTSTKLYVPYGSIIAELAKAQQIDCVFEAFADRNYNSDLTLVSRKNEKALITDSEEVFNHVYNMITEQKVKTLSGVEVGIKADTFCVHGDHPKALELTRNLTEKLYQKNIEIR